MGAAARLPHGRAGLRQAPVLAGQEDRPGHQAAQPDLGRLARGRTIGPNRRPVWRRVWGPVWRPVWTGRTQHTRHAPQALSHKPPAPSAQPQAPSPKRPAPSAQPQAPSPKRPAPSARSQTCGRKRAVANARSQTPGPKRPARAAAGHDSVIGTPLDRPDPDRLRQFDGLRVGRGRHLRNASPAGTG